jgi:hypothetical protein
MTRMIAQLDGHERYDEMASARGDHSTMTDRRSLRSAAHHR